MITRSHSNVIDVIRYTVKPVYNGHPWDLKNVVVTQRVD
jgi:hypothetical protein